MKLKDCGCGGKPQVTFKINEHSDFVAGCTVCDNRTPICKSLAEAVSEWNQIYCCSLPFYMRLNLNREQSINPPWLKDKVERHYQE